jgi:hypothetical protein
VKRIGGGVVEVHGRSQGVTIPDAVEIQFWPPENEHSNARNMSKCLM